jgi:riboflavin synthase
MFTGIVATTGSIADIDRQDGQARFVINTGDLQLDGLQLGDSISVNGVCLTAVEIMPASFSADLSRETLELTTLGELQSGACVNLERALAMGDSLGGHMVTGHVDGVGCVQSLQPDAGSVRISIEAPAELARYIAQKGSVCVDGISLTVNSVEAAVFNLMIVPHTQERTVISNYQPGTRVNIEVDIIARYLERMAQFPASDAD